MANSVNPDQTAPRNSLIWVYTVCPGVSVQKLWIITVMCSNNADGMATSDLCLHCLQRATLTFQKLRISTVDLVFEYVFLQTNITNSLCLFNGFCNTFFLFIIIPSCRNTDPLKADLVCCIYYSSTVFLRHRFTLTRPPITPMHNRDQNQISLKRVYVKYKNAILSHTLQSLYNASRHNTVLVITRPGHGSQVIIFL